MGFSLEGMFNDLINIIENEGLGDHKKREELIHEILWWHNYAIQCGQIKEQ